MSGQSAHLTLEEARKMQTRVQHTSSHALSNGGKKDSAGSMKENAQLKKLSHQGKC